MTLKSLEKLSHDLKYFHSGVLIKENALSSILSILKIVLIISKRTGQHNSKFIVVGNRIIVFSIYRCIGLRYFRLIY